MYSIFSFFILFKNITVKIKMLKICVLTIILGFLILACTKTVYVDTSHIKDNQYDSEFPVFPTAQYIEEISNSVKLINVVTGYRVYHLPSESRILSDELNEDLIKEITSEESYINSPVSGTATIIHNSDSKIALLTCAHILNFPDTIIIKQLNEKGIVTPFIKSVYFRSKQNITIPELPDIDGFEILASDIENDIAVIGKKYSLSDMRRIAAFNFPNGHAKELKPGMFVYLFGYPRGKKMVTASIVGEIERDKNYGFIIDAAVHNGVSGGPVVAIRDGVPNFELVGMVFAIAGEMLQFLSPDVSETYDVYSQNKYSGDIYLKSKRQIIYGLTYVKSIEEIKDFFDDSRDEFLSKGYKIDQFLN